MKKQESKDELGVCCAHGAGGTKEAVKAMKWFCNAAKQGNADVTVTVGSVMVGIWPNQALGRVESH